MPGAVWYELLRDSEDGDGLNSFNRVASVGDVPDAPVTSLEMPSQPLADAIHHSYRMRACNKINCSTSASVLAEATLAVAGTAAAPGNLAGAVERVAGAVGDGVLPRAMATTSRSLFGGGRLDVLAIGLPGSSANAGSVLIYQRSSLNQLGWVLVQTMAKPGAETGDMFGKSVALSPNGNWLAIGVPGDNQAGAGIGPQLPPRDPASGPHPRVSDSGAVYLYRLVDNSWALAQVIKAINPGADDGFGTSVALSENGYLAVGAPNEDSGAAGGIYVVNADPLNFDTGLDAATFGDAPASADSGAVYLYTVDRSSPRFEAYIKPQLVKGSGAAHFGSALALDRIGEQLAVGAPRATVLGNQAGAVLFYRRNGSVWQFQGDAAPDDFRATADDKGFGSALAMSADGKWTAVGFPERMVDGKAAAGEVYVYRRGTTGPWSKKESVVDPKGTAYDRFGISVALGGTDGSNLSLLVGAREDGGRGIAVLREQDIGAIPRGAYAGAGAGFLFNGTVTSTLKLRARLESPAPLSSEYLGLAVALTADGTQPLLTGQFDRDASALFYAY